jgi:hypothetical protein
MKKIKITHKQTNNNKLQHVKKVNEHTPREQPGTQVEIIVLQTR